MHAHMSPIVGVKPVAIGTTDTGQAGKILDLQGFQGVEFLISYGEITATNAAYTITVKKDDTTGSMTSIADADLRGTEAAAMPGTGTRTSGSTKNVTKRIGYIGSKRYVQCGVRSTMTAGTLVSVVAVKGFPENGPVA